MIFNTKQCYWDVTETSKLKKSLTKHSRKKPEESKEPAKKQLRDPTSSQPHRRLRKSPKITEIIEFGIEPHQVAFDSDFSDWDVKVLRVPDNEGPNWQLHWIKSMSFNISELRRPRRRLKDVSGEPTGPTSFSWLIAWLAPGYSTTSEFLIITIPVDSSGQWMLASG